MISLPLYQPIVNYFTITAGAHCEKINEISS